MNESTEPKIHGLLDRRQDGDRPLPSPQVIERRWCHTCGDHLLKDEPGPHCDQCSRWDRVFRGLQSAPPPRPVKRVTLLSDHVEALYSHGDPFLRVQAP